MSSSLSEDQAAFDVDEIEAFTLLRSDIEDSKHRTPKIARMKSTEGARYNLERCHQMYTNDRSKNSYYEVVVCRDANYEVIMPASYGEEFPRYARAKGLDGKPVYFDCKKVAEDDFSPHLYGGTSVHKCLPSNDVPEKHKAKFAQIDKKPELDEAPTNRILLPTKRTDEWKNIVKSALPDGVYFGRARTASKKCKVEVSIKSGETSVIISRLQSNGEYRTQASADLNNELVAGYETFKSVEQRLTNKNRESDVFIASLESQTTTEDYYSRNFKVIRATGASSNGVEKNHSAVYIGYNAYCQRLSDDPENKDFRLPAWLE